MEPKFSTRTRWDLGESDLARVVREERARGRELVDLTISNPTQCGFTYDADAILGALTDAAAMTYEPDARGLRSAREAVAAYYAGHGAEIDPDACVLTTSTSEAYSFLFCLLCDAGDEVLVAQPSYPLFDFIAELDHVVLRPYPLFYDFGWWIDFAELERRIGPRTRAILLVHPNNPTGHATSAGERAQLEELCARHGLALVVDEVFLDYGLREPVRSFATEARACLTFIVSGLSKVAALPQMKVGWLVCLGPATARQEAQARLEVIADTFLSLNAPAQHALPAWLRGRKAVTRQILSRVRENVAQVQSTDGLGLLPVAAGWSGILHLARSDEIATVLVREAGVITHPGLFYGIAASNLIVVSLIVDAGAFAAGMQKLKLWSESRELTFSIPA